MKFHEIETWALNIIDRVQQKLPVEDSRVECKREWPTDAKRVARRIAGHANAARGESILWLIGVDEKSGEVPGVKFVEFDSWFRAVAASFDEMIPEVKPLAIPVVNGVVVALFFETERAPFVVNVAEGGSVQREVPWRVSTGIQSATRAHLIKMLSPLQKRPTIEVVGSVLRTLHIWQSDGGKTFLPWEIRIALFVTQPIDQEIVIPSHRCSLAINLSDHERLGPFEGQIEFLNDGWNNVNVAPSGVIIKGSALIEIKKELDLVFEPSINKSFLKDASLDLVLSPSNLDGQIEIPIPLKIPSSDKLDFKQGKWINGKYHRYWRFIY